jgi:hypothetical protein
MFQKSVVTCPGQISNYFNDHQSDPIPGTKAAQLSCDHQTTTGGFTMYSIFGVLHN